MTAFRDERRGAVELWTLDGESRRNALSHTVLTELEQRVARVSASRETRVVVLTGAGDKAFCSGLDLKEQAHFQPAQVRGFLQTLRRAFRALETSDCVFIAALNGAALGAGMELALACDLRVAAPAAELGLPEVKLGAIPAGGGTQRLTRLVGAGRAKDLILTGRRLSAAEAFTLGVVNRLAPEGRLLEVAMGLADAIAANAPLSVAAAKHAVDEGEALPLDDALALELEKYEQVLTSEDRREGMSALSEKRAPL